MKPKLHHLYNFFLGANRKVFNKKVTVHPSQLHLVYSCNPMFLVFALPFLTAGYPGSPPGETPVSPRLSADVDHEWFSRNVSGWRHKSFWTQHYLYREFRNQRIEEIDLYLKLRFLSCNLEILLSSSFITQGYMIKDNNLFFFGSALMSWFASPFTQRSITNLHST